jgi:hypothetical protein
MKKKDKKKKKKTDDDEGEYIKSGVGMPQAKTHMYIGLCCREYKDWLPGLAATITRVEKVQARQISKYKAENAELKADLNKLK